MYIYTFAHLYICIYTQKIHKDMYTYIHIHTATWLYLLIQTFLYSYNNNNNDKNSKHLFCMMI